MGREADRRAGVGINMLNIGSIQLPLNSVTKTFAILAKRGAGKTYTADVMAEEFYKNSLPFVIFDPIDVHWGLRLNRDGKTQGLPVVVFGIEHADIQLEKDMGREIARAVVKENISCVISTFGLSKKAQRFLIAEFAEEILNINSTPRHIFIEEAHEFVPQRVFGELGRTFSAVSNLVVMGRNRGLGVTLINQRAATINKDVLTQIDTLLAFRNIAPQDRKALREWVEFHAAEGDFEDFMQSLPSLPTGEGWIWSPEFLQVFQKVKIRKRETFHPDREKLGEDFVMPQLGQTDVQGFINRFRVAQQEQQKKLEVETKGKRGRKSKKSKELETVKASEVYVLEDQNFQVQALKNEYESKLISKDTEIARLNRIIENVRNAVGASADAPIVANGDVSFTSNGILNMWIEKIGKNSGMARILSFLAQRPNMTFTRPQLGLAVKISPKTGTYRNYLSILRRNSLIIEESGQVRINPDVLK